MDWAKTKLAKCDAKPQSTQGSFTNNSHDIWFLVSLSHSPCVCQLSDSHTSRKKLSTEVALAERYEIFSRKFETAKPKDKIDFEWSQQQTHAHAQCSRTVNSHDGNSFTPCKLRLSSSWKMNGMPVRSRYCISLHKWNRKKHRLQMTWRHFLSHEEWRYGQIYYFFFALLFVNETENDEMILARFFFVLALNTA